MFYSTVSPTTSQKEPFLLQRTFSRQTTHGLSWPTHPQPRPEIASHFLTTKFVPHHVLSPPKYHPCPFPSPLSSMFCSVTDFWWLTGLLPILNSLATWNPGSLLPNCELLSGRGLCLGLIPRPCPQKVLKKVFCCCG